MDPYRIRDGIGFACFEGRTIILDVTADRYWQLGADAGAALEALRTGVPDRVDAQALMRLRAFGFVEPATTADPGLSGHTVPAQDSISPPSGSLIEGPALSRRGDGWVASEVALLAFTARAVLRARPLAAVLDRITTRRARTRAREDGPGLDVLAQQFARLRRLVPLRPLCLPDSLAFLWFAMRRGHAPRLVFGVEAFPFTAHCWVQDGSLVLTDALDHASRFRPILIL